MEIEDYLESQVPKWNACCFLDTSVLKKVCSDALNYLAPARV